MSLENLGIFPTKMHNESEVYEKTVYLEKHLTALRVRCRKRESQWLCEVILGYVMIASAYRDTAEAAIKSAVSSAKQYLDDFGRECTSILGGL